MAACPARPLILKRRGTGLGYEHDWVLREIRKGTCHATGDPFRGPIFAVRKGKAMIQREAVRLGKKTAAEMKPIAEEALLCYQCGTCSGACPVAAAGGMDYTPRAIMRLIQAGMEEEVLSCQTIWACASCYACVVRCPRDIEITDVMTQLRHVALKKGYKARRGKVYNEGFMDIVRRHGRMYEPELVIRYNLLTNPLNFLGLAPVGLKMILKRKLRFLPDHPAGRADIRGIFDRLEGGEE
jgi:heterodisulfide reductase subunit C